MVLHPYYAVFIAFLALQLLFLFNKAYSYKNSVNAFSILDFIGGESPEISKKACYLAIWILRFSLILKIRIAI
ncbi:MAG: hypothetical protein LAT67_14875 [Balneolales bacterium]|nr:hypothetical protein [Balneolales bacterium]